MADAEPNAGKTDSSPPGSPVVPPELQTGRWGIPRPHGGPVLPLAFSALGVVYGDIGTSPIYAVKECFTGRHGVAPTEANVLGVLSLFFWSLTVVVSVKYLSFILRADNKGEGGIFALLALIPQKLDAYSTRVKGAVTLAALFGAALLYGDGVITPAISVLSAVEGLEVATSAASSLVVPLTCLILVGLFLVQKRGTDRIGRVFGPVMLMWFVVIAALGVAQIVRFPHILSAINPMHGAAFFAHDPHRAFLVLGAVVLCITGGEALYADMGHFGQKPIRLAWFSCVFPALLLNYFGQGAYLLSLEGPVPENLRPFYAIVPDALLYPMVALATAATVIASQALISGVFSLTRQAVQMGYWPRVTVVHTSAHAEGQIFVPEMNTALMVACVALVAAFKTSSSLAAAYGIAVTGTMGITSLVYYFVVTRSWGWSAWKALPLVAMFLFFDIAFFGANLLKFFDGGWFPIAVGVGVFTLMTTWKRGRMELGKRFLGMSMPIEQLLEEFKGNPIHRVRGTAVFMSGSADGTPPVLLHHLKHNQVLHRQVVLLSVIPADVPTVPLDVKLEVQELGEGFFRLVSHSGFMETPNVPEILKRARKLGLVCEPSTTSYYLGRETLLTTGKSKMSRWRKMLFAFVSRNALPATSYFQIPPGRVVELGMQVDV